MVSINQALRTVKEDLATLLDPHSIFEICLESGHRWRRSLLNSAVLTHLFVMQILSGNTAFNHLRHLSGLAFTASAYWQARKRSPLQVIQRLVHGVCGWLNHSGAEHTLWRGRRVWRVDGSGASMPDTVELQAYFRQPGGQKPGCGFPMASMLCLMHAGTGLLIDLLAGPFGPMRCPGS